MAKQGGNYRKVPFTIKPAAMEDYVLLTEANKKTAMVTGRVLHVIDDAHTKNPKYCGYKTFDPCFSQGLYRITLPEFWDIKEFSHAVKEDQNVEEWKKMWVSIVNDGIKKGRLFIKKNEPLIKYFKL